MVVEPATKSQRAVLLSLEPPRSLQRLTTLSLLWALKIINTEQVMHKVG
jgi:hypothetical protein